MVSETRLIAGAFPRHEDAQAAVEGLKQAGFDDASVSVLYTDAGHAISAGVLDGAVWGGVIGGLFGLLFPPVGLLVAAGPILGALTSGLGLAAAGAVTVGALEGVISGLVQLGMPKEVATSLGQHLHKGDALVIAHAATEQQADQAQAIMQAHSPRAEGAPSTGGVISVSPTNA